MTPPCFRIAPSGLPQNVQATANSSTAVLVSWMPVLGIDQNGIIIMYEIQYEPLMTFDGFVEGGTVNTSSGTEFILLVTALEEFVEYNISVRAYTSVGPGPFSPTETERTLEDGRVSVLLCLTSILVIKWLTLDSYWIGLSQHLNAISFDRTGNIST